VRTRLISAAVLVPVVVLVFLAGDPWLILGIALLAGLAAYEVARLVTAAGLRGEAWFAVPAAMIAVIGIGWRGPNSFLDLLRLDPFLNPVIFVALVVVLAGGYALRFQDPGLGFLAWAGNVVAATYPSLLAFATLLLTSGPSIPERSFLGNTLDAGRIWIMILVLTVWALDSAAYVSGKYVPRGHFMNHISPMKTWSGALGGTTVAVAVCTLLVWAAGQQPWFGIILGLVIAVAAQAGDLAESMLKRAAGAKDSGNLIPGHGGILDRVDSFLFAAPALFITLSLLDDYFRA
jgi:phosphatidate cytidylyltransferase